MSKKVYVAVQYHTIDEREKHWHYATVEQLGGSNNLVHEVDRLKRDGAAFIMVCDTKKEAQEVVTMWNNGSRDAGCLGFAEWANMDYRAEERKAV
jgi:hypothetical protein